MSHSKKKLLRVPDVCYNIKKQYTEQFPDNQGYMTDPSETLKKKEKCP